MCNGISADSVLRFLPPFIKTPNQAGQARQRKIRHMVIKVPSLRSCDYHFPGPETDQMADCQTTLPGDIDTDRWTLGLSILLIASV
jgi:hypothetical protein